MDLKEIGINTGNWLDSAQDRDYWRALVNAALNLRVPQTIEFVSLSYVVLWVIKIMLECCVCLYFCP